MTPEKAKELPWPLVAVTTFPNDHLAKFDSDEDAADAFHAFLEQICWVALKNLREAGRLREVRRLKLVCYNTETDS